MESVYNKIAAIETLTTGEGGKTDIVAFAVTCGDSKYVAYVDVCDTVEPEEINANYAEAVAGHPKWMERGAAVRVYKFKDYTDMVIGVATHVKALKPCRAIVWDIGDILHYAWDFATRHKVIGIHYDFLAGLEQARYVNGRSAYAETSVYEEWEPVNKTLLSDLSIKEPFDVFSDTERLTRSKLCIDDPLLSLTDLIISAVGIEILQEEVRFVR